MKPMEGFLTAEEMARLNAVLTRDEFWCPNVVAIIRLLMLTGCRFGKIAALEWGRDTRQAHLPSRFEARPAHGLAVGRRAHPPPSVFRQRTAADSAFELSTWRGSLRHEQRYGWSPECQ